MSCISPSNCFVNIGFISFWIIPIRFVSFRFRFVSVNFVSIYFVSFRFRFVSVNFVSIYFVSFRFDFVSHFTVLLPCFFPLHINIPRLLEYFTNECKLYFFLATRRLCHKRLVNLNNRRFLLSDFPFVVHFWLIDLITLQLSSLRLISFRFEEIFCLYLHQTSYFWSQVLSVSLTYANILKYHIQGMPTNIILQVFI